MKNYYYLIVMLLLASFVTTAKVHASEVTIKVDNPSYVKITTRTGEVVSITKTEETFNLEGEPLLIESADPALYELVEVKQDGTSRGINRGQCRVGISGIVEITTRSLAGPVNKRVAFGVTDPSHIIVKNGEEVLTITKGVALEIPQGAVLTIQAASEEFSIESVKADGKPIEGVGGIYSVTVNDDVTITIVSKKVLPMLTFDIDYPGRVKVLNADENDTEIDISSGTALVEKGTALTILPSDSKYTIKSVTVGEKELTDHGGYHTGVTGDMTFVIKTSSTVPAVKFDVDHPENVTVTREGTTDALDLSKIYELEKGTQLVIKAANDEVRIASVLIDGFKLTPLADGSYKTAITDDVTLIIKTKGILPILTFNVDAPERIKVMKGAEELNFSEVIELPEGTEITIEPAADNFSIVSVQAGEKALTAGEDNKYHVTVSGDMEFTIKTSATLTLHIATTDGGTVTVFRGETELKEGDKVQTGDELTFKNTFNVGYAFLAYYVNGKECKGPAYTVTGSVDITVSGMFKTVPENHAMVIFDVEDPLVSIYDESVHVDPSQPYEIEKGHTLSIYVYSTGVRITLCEMNGVAVPADENDPNSYHIIINDNATIKVRTEQLVLVRCDLTNDAALNRVGDVYIKVNGVEVHNTLARVNDELELVPRPEAGYELEYYFRNYNEDDRFTGNIYKVRQEDFDNESHFIVIKGAFKKVSAIDNVETGQSYYDAAAKNILSAGGKTEVYTISGETVISTMETVIPVSDLAKGVYIVKAQDRIFKLIKE